MPTNLLCLLHNCDKCINHLLRKLGCVGKFSPCVYLCRVLFTLSSHTHEYFTFLPLQHCSTILRRLVHAEIKRNTIVLRRSTCWQFRCDVFASSIDNSAFFYCIATYLHNLLFFFLPAKYLCWIDYHFRLKSSLTRLFLVHLCDVFC